MRPYPQLTCVRCDETKSALHFPKRAGSTYAKYLSHDPRRYDPVCKWCRKPRKPGQAREDVPRPKVKQKQKGGKARMTGDLNPRKRKKERLSAGEYKARTRSKTRVKSMQYLSKKGCEECGERDPRVLEYDHKITSEKNGTISRLIIDGYGWSARRLRTEIRKCRVLCANCHRKHTIKQQGYYAQKEVQWELGILAGRYKFDL